MGKKDQRENQKAKNQRVEDVLHLLRKHAPLTWKQEKFCSNSCVERFLRAKGENVKKASKQLRACLSWRDCLGIENLTAAEFSAEFADGVAYLAGNDEESRPVLIFRVKQDYQKFDSHKHFTRLVVFTLEAAISTMPKKVEQFVVLFDASFFRSASAFMNLLLGTLKILVDYYPCRLYRAFVIDPPSVFYYIWKGVRPFVELSTVTIVVSSRNYEESLDFCDVPSLNRSASLRFDPSSIRSTATVGPCSSSRFAFTVSHHLDSLKPWYLSLTDTSASKVGPTSRSPRLSPISARSLSFASPATRGFHDCNELRRSLFTSTPLPEKTSGSDSVRISHPRTPRPSFFRSPATFFNKAEKSRDVFVPYLKFYRRPYEEVAHRSKLRAPLNGFVSVVSPQVRGCHVSASQRF